MLVNRRHELIDALDDVLLGHVKFLSQIDS